jgi:hypothetical protein
MNHRATIDAPNPSGVCMCGCGERTTISRQSDLRRGWLIGSPVRYIPGHHARRTPEDFTIDEVTGCWLWSRHLNTDGYGQKGDRRVMRHAHIVYWERANGPVPDGLELDHLCRQRSCVNPAHLEPVTHLENIRRGIAARAEGR